MCPKHSVQHVTECGVAWLTRLLWEQEIAGSNPVTPTEILNIVFPIWCSFAKRMRSPENGALIG